MPTRTKPACPNCPQGHGVPILYGLPAHEAFEEAEQGKIALGGCVVSGDDPQWRCLECGHTWGMRPARGERSVCCRRRRVRPPRLERHPR